MTRTAASGAKDHTTQHFSPEKMGFSVRPILARDLAPLMSTVGLVVDLLYPQGASKLLHRLESALNGYATAHVVAAPNTRPVALAAETAKESRNVKLSTFWVHPSMRQKGIGGLLLDNRIKEWTLSERDGAVVTVRECRASDLERLFIPRGFSRIATEIDKYGEGQNEVILKWRPSLAHSPYQLLSVA